MQYACVLFSLQIRTPEIIMSNSLLADGVKVFTVNKSASDESNLESDSSKLKLPAQVHSNNSGDGGDCSGEDDALRNYTTDLGNMNSDLESSSEMSHLSRSSSHTSTGSQEDNHRYLHQCSDPTCSCTHSCCSSWYSSDSYNTSDEDSSYGTTDTGTLDQSSEYDFDFGNDSTYYLYDAHLPLIQSSDFSSPFIYTHSVSDDSGDSSKSFHDDQESAQVMTTQQSVDKISTTSENRLCIQCYAWPEVQKLKGTMCISSSS